MASHFAAEAFEPFLRTKSLTNMQANVLNIEKQVLNKSYPILNEPLGPHSLLYNSRLLKLFFVSGYHLLNFILF